MSALPHVLLTGFEPFGGEAINPSWEAVRALQGEVIAGHRIEVLCLPVVFGAALAPLRAALRRRRPALVIAVGLAASRSVLSVERVAINLDDARIPDNAGAQPVDRPVVPGGPSAYFSRLPVKAIRQAWLEAGLPAEVSQTAGTFVCNHVFYALLHTLRRRPAVRAGFIHVPPLPELAAPGVQGLALERVVQGLRIAVAITLTHGEGDLAATAGAID